VGNYQVMEQYQQIQRGTFREILGLEAAVARVIVMVVQELAPIPPTTEEDQEVPMLEGVEVVLDIQLQERAGIQHRFMGISDY